MPRGYPDLEDLAGRRFFRLTVVGPSRDAKGRKRWLCSCECGNTTSQAASDLRLGKAKSCGCWRKEEIAGRVTTHGHARGRRTTGEYSTWLGMKERCTHPGHKQWADYGGRGIAVCDRWATSFEAFLTDMGPKPSRQHQIDRINNDRGYEPGNCRWVTPQRNGANKRNNRILELAGQALTLAEWARETGLRATTIYIRIHNLGWTVERALTTPSAAKKPGLRRGRPIEFQGRVQPAKQWSSETGIPLGTLLSRLNKHGWSIERALTTPVRKRGSAAA